MTGVFHAAYAVLRPPPPVEQQGYVATPTLDYKSKRQTPPKEEIFSQRQAWGARLRHELERIGQTPEWLGQQVGYQTHSSMRQVINGHQGCSREVYDKILQFVPEMTAVPAPPMSKEKQGAGAPGQHKTHNYPKGTTRT